MPSLAAAAIVGGAEAPHARTTMSGRAGEWRTPWSAGKVDAASEARHRLARPPLQYNSEQRD